MNTGIQDMINLSWKLASVLHGHADPKLLDTYNDDRLPVIHDVLSHTEGLTDAIGSENTLFRSVFSHIAPWVVGKDFVQEQATEQMSQLSLGYRKSPVSVTRSAVGEIKAGDRVPDAEVLLVGGAGSPTTEPKQAGLLTALRTDCFTLLFLNLKDSPALHAAVQVKLAPWKDLLQTVSVQIAAGSADGSSKAFGKSEGLVLVRPDGYAAFTGTPADLDDLAHYFHEWFPQQKSSPKE